MDEENKKEAQKRQSQPAQNLVEEQKNVVAPEIIP